jgi:hypothetical protein
VQGGWGAAAAVQHRFSANPGARHGRPPTEPPNTHQRERNRDAVQRQRAAGRRQARDQLPGQRPQQRGAGALAAAAAVAAVGWTPSVV